MTELQVCMEFMILKSILSSEQIEDGLPCLLFFQNIFGNPVKMCVLQQGMKLTE